MSITTREVGHTPATLGELHEETGYGFDNLLEASVFAKVYTRGQLDELCGLRTPAGMPPPGGTSASS